MSSTESGATVIIFPLPRLDRQTSTYGALTKTFNNNNNNNNVQDASNPSPVNLSSAIVDLNHILRRRRPSIENVRCADAVVRTLSSEI